MRLLSTSAIGYGLHQTWPIVAPASHAPEWMTFAWAGVALICAKSSLSLLGGVAQGLTKLSRSYRALRPRLPSSSAKWLTPRQARKAKLGKTEGVFLGILEGQPLFINDAVHSLICAPSRKGKTTSFVMPALCHDIGASRLVTDMRGDLAYQTAHICREDHDHEVITLNPAHKFSLGNASYNPMQIILDDLRDTPEDAIADTWSLAKQLHKTPQGGDRDPFWPNGTRKLLVFVIIGLCTLREEFEANLPNTFNILGDDSDLLRLLNDALNSDILAGEVSKLASNILSTWKENPKHNESFREAAVQSLASFGPSGRIAPSIESCDFRFRDLKRKKMTIFIICDPSRMDVFEPWIGILIWAALKELIREDNAIPVHFLMDEFTSFKISELPTALTALGGYGIHLWIIVQALLELQRVYGFESMKAVLSQCDCIAFFGVNSDETAQLVSNMLGKCEETKENFGLGTDLEDMPSLSIGDNAHPLMVPDQLRRMPDDEIIMFIKNLDPIRALKVGYQEVAPWRLRVKASPMFGDKPFLGKVKMRMKASRARATLAGRRKIDRNKRPLFRPLISTLAGLVSGGTVLLLAVSWFAVSTYGWPHLRITYNYRGSAAYPVYTRCQYIGLPLVGASFTLTAPATCPIIIWQKQEE